mgnify:CR=1 FL=1
MGTFFRGGGMSDFLSEAERLLTIAARPLDVAQLGAMIAERSEVVFPGRRPGITVAARLRAARGRGSGCYEVGPGMWSLPAVVPPEASEGESDPSDTAEGPNAEAWRASVFRLLDAMGYREAGSITADTWRAKIGWGSAETDVFLQLDGRNADLVPEAVVEHRRALVENACLAGVLVCRGRAGAGALLEARRAGAPLVTIVDGSVILRALKGRAKRRP